MTSETATSVVDESNTNATTVEKVSGEIDKLFQKASKNKPVVTINGRVITEFEYLIFEWQYDYANLSDKEIKERIISDVLISQQAKKMKLKISEETDKGIIWLRDEGSFTSEESEKKYKMPKQELVDIVEGVFNIGDLHSAFEDIFFKKLVDGTLGEIDPYLKEACDEYQKIQADVDAFKVSYKRLEDCYQKTLNNYIDLLKSRATIIEGS